MKKQLNPLITTILFMVALVAVACASNTTVTLPSPQPTATLDKSSNLAAPAGPPDPSAPAQEATPGEAVALAYNPAGGNLLKADNQGLFRWQAGRGWEQMLEAQQPGLSGVAVNPDQPTTVYISGPGLGVLRSNDGGNNWQEINTGLPDLNVTALAMHSFRRDTLYAWIINDGIYRTEDGGVGWEKMPDVPIADPQVRGLVHSTLEGSMNTGWLYAATPSGAYLSMD
jgi:photosystem II stability/assembly factor-like uncharacterized protein